MPYKNKEQQRKAQREWVAKKIKEDPEYHKKVLENKKRYREKNKLWENYDYRKDKRHKWDKKYYENNKDEILKRKKERRKRAIRKHITKTIGELIEFTGNRFLCQCCLSPTYSADLKFCKKHSYERMLQKLNIVDSPESKKIIEAERLVIQIHHINKFIYKQLKQFTK